MDNVAHIEDLLYSGEEDIRPTLIERIIALEKLDYIKHQFIDEQLTILENLWVEKVKQLVIVVLFE